MFWSWRKIGAAVMITTLAVAFEAQAGPAALKVGKTYSGFKLISERQIPEIHALGRVFEHSCGLKLLKFETDDNNKSFAATFLTPPEGDFGIPHILEHAVLNGSKKFPVKSPFDVLAKGSLNTFLNAMTSDDFTMYPVASTNTKDFFNLVEVYLDAVFQPRIHDDPRIFEQEGWHYEMESPEAALTVNGIVYNEMKGAYSSPERVLDLVVSRALFPDSPYGLASGGHPESIWRLKREQLLAFHKKYYHPSNAYITLWGNGDTLAELRFINDQALKNVKRHKRSAQIPLQKSFDAPRTVQAEYPIAASEDPAAKTYLSMTWMAGGATQVDLSMALDVLSDALVNTPASPLRKALEQAGIGKDSYASYYDIKQGVFSLVVKNAESADRERFEKLVLDTLGTLAAKGLDRKLLEGVINKLEFRLREADYGGFPMGLVYTYFGIRGWMFAGDPFLGVAYEAPLAKVRAGLEAGLFEELIREQLLDNPHRVLAVVSPKPGLEEDNTERLEQELAKIRAGLKEPDRNRIVEHTRALKAWQAEDDKPEDLAKIPMLTLADLDKTEKRLPVAERQVAGARVLHFDHSTNGIIYLQVMFDAQVVPQELIPYLPLLADLFKELDTTASGYARLNTELNIHTGGLEFSVVSHLDERDGKRFQPRLVLSGKALTPKFAKLIALAGEIALQTRFDDHKRLAEVLGKVYSRYEGMARGAGVQLAIQRLESYLSANGAYGEAVGGLSFIQFLSRQMASSSADLDALAADLGFLASLVFNKNNLVVGVTCSQADYAVFEQHLPGLIDALDAAVRPRQDYRPPTERRNEGLLAASKVQYVTQGANYRDLGFAYSGQLDVLNQILSRDFLTEKIRVQGGAYGAWASFGRSGFAYFGSYRDPHLKETLGVFTDSVGYLKDFGADDREMTRYIIGVIARRDQPLSPSALGRKAISNVLRNVSADELQKARDEILATRQQDLRALAPLVEAVLKKNTICVYGNENKIEENKDLFQALVKVLD